jgi:thiamine biosynthesis lipoprotein
MNKKIIYSLIVVVLGIALASAFFLQKKGKVEYIHNEGKTQGTYYTATYLQPEGVDLQQKIETRLHEFDLSLSTYNSASVISRINRNDTMVRTDSYFETMFKMAQSVSERTNGAFDITVGPLVKAWGFGLGNSNHSKTPKLSEILPLIGYHKVRLVNHKILKDDPRILIDANGIAQGYSSDIIAELLKDNGCKNYMIEIGGEIVCKGLNPKGQKWQIGIDKAIDDSTNSTNELQTILSLTNCAVTTAGGYRKFYIKNGRKYSHIIDPRTGYPVNNNLLSVTVVAPTALMADAYDTPFMVLGVDSCLKLCKSIPGMDCYLIYVDKKGKNQVIFTDGFKKYLSN